MKSNCYRRAASFSMNVLSFCLVTIFLAGPTVSADSYSAYETSSSFGNLAQPFPFGSESNPNPYVCAQTAVVNSFVYLQNQYPSTYDTNLVPSYDGEPFTSFNSMDQVAKTLNNNSRYIPTTWSGNDAIVRYGTTAWGTYRYVWDRMGGTYSKLKTYFYAETTSMTNWTQSWETNPPNDHVSGIAENPTWSFLYNGLNSGDAVVFGWSSPDSTRGHYMTLTGFQFNPSAGNAMISYLDPKDAAQYNNVPIYLNPDGTIGFIYNNTGHPWYSGNVEIKMALVYGPNQLSTMDLSGVPNLPPVPVPPSVLLLGSGLIGLAGYGRIKFKK